MSDVLPTERVDEHDNDAAASRLDKVFDERNALIRAGVNPLSQLLLGSAPWAGGVGALLSLKAQQRQEARLRSFLLDLARDVERQAAVNADKIDSDHIHTDEFTGTLFTVLEEASRTADQSRLEYL